MEKWNMRANEVAYLLNPAFCGRILYTVIQKYNETGNSFPFPLSYLVLPLILHKSTRERIDSRTQLLIWVQRNPELLIDFSSHAKDLVMITNEAMEYLLQSGLIILDSQAGLLVSSHVKKLSKTKHINSEIKQCIQKSEHIAKWFTESGTVENIYVSLGVRP